MDSLGGRAHAVLYYENKKTTRCLRSREESPEVSGLPELAAVDPLHEVDLVVLPDAQALGVFFLLSLLGSGLRVRERGSMCILGGFCSTLASSVCACVRTPMAWHSPFLEIPASFATTETTGVVGGGGDFASCEIQQDVRA